VVADDFAGGGDEFACGVGEFLVLLFIASRLAAG